MANHKRSQRIRDQTIIAIKNRLRLSFPAWYLPNGKINATEGELEKGSSSCERWGICCGALVVTAVIAELVIAWVEPPYNKFLTDSAITDGAIALGIVGEVLFGMWDGRLQTELRDRSNRTVSEAIERASEAHERAAEATKKANEASLELERLRSPRMLNNEQLYRVSGALKQFAPIKFDASVNPGNPEFVGCLNFIELTLMLANWTQVDWNGVGLAEIRKSRGLPSYGMNSSVSNVAIFFVLEDESSKNCEAAIALAEALTAEGITAEARPTLDGDEVGEHKPRPIHIAVGTKT